MARWPIQRTNGKINPYRDKPTAARTAPHAPFTSRHSMPVLCRAPAPREGAAGDTSTARLTHGFPGTLEPPTKKVGWADNLPGHNQKLEWSLAWVFALPIRHHPTGDIRRIAKRGSTAGPAVGAAPAATRSVASQIIRTRAWVPGSQVGRNALLNDLLADLAVSEGRCVASLDVPDWQNDKDREQGEERCFFHLFLPLR